MRGRLEWKYALGLELIDPGFDFSVLCEFRSRLIAGNAEQLLLDMMLEHFGRQGLVKARGTQRTDSTHVLASVRTFNRLELVTETMRATLNVLSTVAPDWLQRFARAEWLERYGRRVEEYWLPKGKAAREEFALRIGEDGYALLDAIDALALETDPALATDPALEKIRTLTWLHDVPMVSTLRQAWAQQFERIEGQAKWRTASNFPPASQRFDPSYDSPYDTDTHYSLKRDFGWSGYKTHLTETCDSHAPHVITNVETTHSTVPDVNATEAIHLRLEQRQLLPALHVLDSGYADSDAFVNNNSKRTVTLVGPLGVDPSWQARAGRGFDLSGFQIDWQDKRVTCPQGKVATRWCESKATRSKSEMTSESTAGAAVINVKFEFEDCFACQMRVYCTRTVRRPRQLLLKLRSLKELERIDLLQLQPPRNESASQLVHTAFLVFRQ